MSEPGNAARDGGVTSGLLRALARVLTWPLIALVKVYQFTLSPILGRQCRFHPTCSWYALEALRRYGAFGGAWMAARRLARCHPFSAGGYDPVPYPDQVPYQPEATSGEAASETSTISPRKLAETSYDC